MKKSVQRTEVKFPPQSAVSNIFSSFDDENSDFEQASAAESTSSQYGFAIKSAAMAHVPDARVRDPEYGVGVGIKGARRGEKKPKHCHYGRLRDGSFTSSFPICIKVVICRSGSSASELQMEMAAINSRHGLSTST